jgi:hypothetical protein
MEFKFYFLVLVPAVLPTGGYEKVKLTCYKLRLVREVTDQKSGYHVIKNSVYGCRSWTVNAIN